MGKHNVLSSRWPHHPRQSAGAGRAIGADDRDLVEPDRDLASEVSDEERSARQSVHTDRDPEDDLHMAAQSSAERGAS